MKTYILKKRNQRLKFAAQRSAIEKKIFNVLTYCLRKQKYTCFLDKNKRPD